jgi:osmotically inducible protein OsmC
MIVRRCFHTHTPAKLVQVLHTSKASAVGGRAGHVKNSDGVVDVKLSLPASLGGKGVQAGTTTPEDLFAAGYAACFGGAAELVRALFLSCCPLTRIPRDR